MITKIEVDTTDVRIVGRFKNICRINNIVAHSYFTQDGRCAASLEISLTEDEQKQFTELCKRIEARITYEVRDA